MRRLLFKVISLCLLSESAFGQKAFSFHDPAWMATQSSGAAGFDFSQIANMFMEFFTDNTASLTNTVDGSDGVTWSNLVGLASFTQITTFNNAPIYRATGGPNGSRCLDFQKAAGATHVGLEFANQFGYAEPFTLFFVTACPVSSINGSQQTFFDQSSPNHGQSFAIVQTGNGGFGLNNGIRDNAFAITNWVVHSFVMNGANSYHRINGVLVSYGNSQGNNLGQVFFGNDTGTISQNIGRWTAILGYHQACNTNDLQTVENQLMSRFGIAANGFSISSNWVAMVNANGGAYPDATTISTLQTYWNGIAASNIDQKIYFVNCMVSNNLTAMLTPLVCKAGKSLWVNHNFTTAKLSVNGVSGDASTMYIDTTVAPSGTVSLIDAGMTVYLYARGGTSTPYNFATQDGSFNDLSLYPNFPGLGTAFDSFNNTSGQGRNVVAHTALGYYSGNRTAANSSIIYFANSGSTHASISTISTSGGSLVGQNIYAFNINNNGSPFGTGYSDDTLSLLALHHGFATNDSFAFYTLSQTMRTSLGGGFK